MSAVIPEKGVCRIVFESTDKDDDYCLDVDAESEIDQSETSSCEEDRIQLAYRSSHTNYSRTEFNKRKDRVVKRIEYSSESECENANKRNKLSITDQSDATEQSPQFKNVPDFTNFLEADLSKLFENDNNTIRKSFSHQHQNDPVKNVEIKVPEIQNNSIVDSQSYMEMTDAVRRLTEVLVLPINQSKVKKNYITHQKELDVHERENLLSKISMQDKSSTHTSTTDYYSNNEGNPLRTYRHPKENCTTLLGKDFQSNATFETKKKTLDNSSQHVKQNKEFKDVDFEQGSDDTMDFNMAVEALNLLKSKGRNFSNESGSIDAVSRNIPKKRKVSNDPPLPDSTIESYSINDPFLYCVNAETNGHLLFDSTLEITDCATGAIIPFESIYQSNNNLLTTDENEFSTLNKSQEDIQTEQIVLPSTIMQLPDNVTCMKLPLHEPELVLSDHDQESVIKGKSYRYSAQHQVEDVQINTSILTDSSLKISKACPSLLPVSTIRKKNESKTTSSATQQCQQKSNNCLDDESKVQKKTEHSNAVLFSGEIAKDSKKHKKGSPKLLTKKINVEAKAKMKNYNDQLDDMNKNIEKRRRRRSSQTSKTLVCSLEKSLETSSTLRNVDSMNEASKDSKSRIGKKGKKNAKNKNNQILQAYLSNSTELKETLHQSPESSILEQETLHQSPEKSTLEQEDEDENGILDRLKKHLAASKPQLSEENQSTEEIQQDLDLDNLKTPLDAFRLTINDSMIKRIVEFTNKKLLGASKKVTIWGYKKTTNELELRAFIGILLISAALKQNNVKMAELWSECFGASIYRATLQQGRFNILLQNLCFGDSISTDKTSKKDVFQIGDPWEEYLDNCKKYPMPKISVKTQNKLEDEDSRQHFTTLRKTTNLSLSVLFSMLDSAAIRGLAFFQKANPNSVMCIRTFFKQVGMALVKPELKEKLMRQNTANSMRELIRRILNKKYKTTETFFLPAADQTLKKQKRCQLCSWNKDRKTRHQCICCQRNMCKEHRAQLCVQCIDSI